MSFFRSFRWAARGLAKCLRERNFRFHIAFAAFMYALLLGRRWFVLTRGGWAALAVCTALVLAAEAFNTALEAVVDLACPARRPLAAKAKDCAAGAVLLCALGSVAAGLALLWQPPAFLAMFSYYKTHVPAFILLLLAIALAGVWVFFPRRK